MEKTQQKKVQLPEEQKQWQKQKCRPQVLLFCPCWTLQFLTQWLILPFKSGVRVKPPFCYSTTPFHIELEIYNHWLNVFVGDCSRFQWKLRRKKVPSKRLLLKKLQQKKVVLRRRRKNNFVRGYYILRGGIFRSKIPPLLIALRVFYGTYRTAIRKMPPTYDRPHSTPPSLSVSLNIVLCLF